MRAAIIANIMQYEAQLKLDIDLKLMSVIMVNINTIIT
jgi:hypothetical protein